MPRSSASWLFDDTDDDTLSRDVQLLGTAIKRLQARTLIGWLHTKMRRLSRH